MTGIYGMLLNGWGCDRTGSIGIILGFDGQIWGTPSDSCFSVSCEPSSVNGGGEGVVCRVVVESTGLVKSEYFVLPSLLLALGLLLDEIVESESSSL